MANTIILKKSSTASSVPAAGSLQPGELAINLADKKLYSKTTGGTVIQVGFGDLTSSLVTTALGYTPYNSTNPNGYITSSGSITGNAATATYASYATVADTRSTVTTPQTISQGVAFDFKANTTEGLSDGGTYFGEMTFRQYGSGTDWSGGLSHQLGFTDNGNVWQRSGSGTTWGSWKKLWDSSNLTNLNQLTNGPGYTSNTGTVTSVSGTGTVSGLTLSGTVTGSGSLTLGGTLSLTSGQVTTALGYTPPQPTGTGASGTWGISITGNAATATTAGALTTTNSYTIAGLTVNGSASVSGNFGIGNTGPGYRLDITSGDTTAGLGYAMRLRSNATAAAAALQFTNNGVTAQNGLLACTDSGVIFLQGDGASSAFAVRTNGSERFRINSSGGVTSSDAADAVGYKGLPQNSQTAAYTLALADQGKHISITTGGVVVPANASIAFPIGTTIVVYNNSAASQSISITTDTLRLAGTATTGTRTIAQRGLATLVKVAATEWVVSGAGVT